MQFSFSNPNVQSLLDRSLQNCPCGRNHTLATTACIIAENAAHLLGEYLTGYSRPVLFCDENTEKYAKALPFYTPESTLVFPGNAHATEVQTAAAERFLEKGKPDVLIACGSGSLHDITRYCAHEKHLPFVSYPTAASVDGFMSGIAAMTWYGQKMSFPSTPPAAVFADPRISADAPERLTASGVGDVLGKYTSIFDWRAAHLLTGEYMCPTIIALTEAALDGVLDALQNREKISKLEYTGRVLEALLVSGLAMQLTGNSRPASAAEHHLSHLWEMAVINPETDALHGEQVAVGTLAVLDTYKAALESGLERLSLSRLNLEKVFSAAVLEPVFGSLTPGIQKENMPAGTPASSSLAKIKITDPAETEAGLKALFAALPSAEHLRDLAESAGCMTTPVQAGLPDSEEFLQTTLTYAPFVRDRLTLLKILSAIKLSKA